MTLLDRSVRGGRNAHARTRAWAPSPRSAAPCPMTGRPRPSTSSAPTRPTGAGAPRTSTHPSGTPCAWPWPPAPRARERSQQPCVRALAQEAGRLKLHDALAVCLVLLEEGARSVHTRRPPRARLRRRACSASQTLHNRLIAEDDNPPASSPSSWSSAGGADTRRSPLGLAREAPLGASGPEAQTT